MRKAGLATKNSLFERNIHIATLVATIVSIMELLQVRFSSFVSFRQYQKVQELKRVYVLSYGIFYAIIWSISISNSITHCCYVFRHHLHTMHQVIIWFWVFGLSWFHGHLLFKFDLSPTELARWFRVELPVLLSTCLVLFVVSPSDSSESIFGEYERCVRHCNIIST